MSMQAQFDPDNNHSEKNTPHLDIDVLLVNEDI